MLVLTSQDYERWLNGASTAGMTATAFGASMREYLASTGVAGWPGPGQLVEPIMHSADIEWSASGTEVVSMRFTGRVGMPNDRVQRFKSLADLRAIVIDNPVEPGAVPRPLTVGADLDVFIYSYSYIFVDRDEATGVI